MCGGDPEVIAGLAPLFDAVGSLTVTMGPFGTGLAAKLARNLVQYGGWLAAYEGQVLAEAAGIELAKLAQVVRASDAQSGGAATLMFRSTVAPFSDEDDRGLVAAMQAAAALAHKDVQAALALAEELELELPLAAMTEGRCGEIFGRRARPPRLSLRREDADGSRTSEARVLVVGGSRGMGRAAAESCAREGARVAVLARPALRSMTPLPRCVPPGAPRASRWWPT